MTVTPTNGRPFSCDSESLAYWYLRLNGFMTTQNFILHNDDSSVPRTDADIFGVRFPLRRELEFDDDVQFRNQAKKPFFIVGEIKRGECRLNGPWTDPKKENMQYLLKAIGAFDSSSIQIIAEALYDRFEFEDENYRIQMVAIGARNNNEYLERRPAPTQWLFENILHFVHKRMNDYWTQKREHQNWDRTGKLLYEKAIEIRDENQFAAEIVAAL